MTAFRRLIACKLRGGKKAGMAVTNRLALVSRPASLGNTETLVQQSASMTHSSYTQEERQKHGIIDGLIRFSIGLEALSDLKHDIAQALDAIHFVVAGELPRSDNRCEPSLVLAAVICKAAVEFNEQH
jgi:methionine-gamma-lyase